MLKNMNYVDNFEDQAGLIEELFSIVLTSNY